MSEKVLTISSELKNHNPEINHTQYENCISLGWFCGCASSLEKLGLRSTSGPFDWYFSDFWAVLEQIENAFTDFMKKENLVQSKVNYRAFDDIKYGFYCNHDIKESFEEEINEVCVKYHKRAKRFLNMITSPTLFIRVIRDEKEIDYINNNWKKAESIIKKYNSKNDIIYAVKKGLHNLTPSVPSFHLEVSEYIMKPYEMRHLLDSSTNLITFLSSSFQNQYRAKNLSFDKEKNYYGLILGYVNKCLEESIDGIERAILEGFGTCSNEPIYLWGAGNYGIQIANYLRERNVNVLGIIDNSYTNKTEINNIPISGFDLAKNYKRIFIAVANEKSNEEIVQQINTSQFPNIKILKFKDLNFHIDL